MYRRYLCVSLILLYIVFKDLHISCTHSAAGPVALLTILFTIHIVLYIQIHLAFPLPLNSIAMRHIRKYFLVQIGVFGRDSMLYFKLSTAFFADALQHQSYLCSLQGVFLCPRSSLFVKVANIGRL